MCGRNRRGRSKFDAVALETVARGNDDWWHLDVFVYMTYFGRDASILFIISPTRAGQGHICLKLITKQNASFVTKYSNKKSKLIANEFVPPLRPTTVGLRHHSQTRHIYIPLTQRREHSQSIKIPCQSTLPRHGATGVVMSAVLGTPEWR